ncbi:putative protein of unknown function (DUF4246) [Lyophyllum shimeji]|uniref:DUF4246 domain-containing protein n=1 Tax=Lyophyllum shimeji TaxID=47721 RepID=A0A9P3UVH4_LYOSH|nr:putative protein of unknown function (DUF4246) [Lyophyllum shimeji]
MLIFPAVKASSRLPATSNNLHPEKHKDLYAVTEQVIARAIPLWNLSLTPVRLPLVSNRIKFKCPEYDMYLEDMSDSEGPRREDAKMSTNEKSAEKNGSATCRTSSNRNLGILSLVSVPPHLEDQYPIEGPRELKPDNTVDIWREYEEDGLQIIAKLANIHLTPEKPEYEGGTWHVEGQLHICASAIYNYDSDNLTTSRVAFRQQSNVQRAELKMSYPQGDHDFLEEVFGCEQGGSGVQDLVTVDNPEGRLLTWPNILQHQVQPFNLVDSSKSGHRKIPALFLVV